MTSTASDRKPQPIDPPEPDLTAQDLVDRAERISAGLVERQAETEERTQYGEQTHREITEAGLYRILVPRRYGGYEFGVDTFVRAAIAIARGCGSTGWMYAFGTSHALQAAAVFGEDAQRELFGSGHFVCPMTVRPQGYADRAPGDDGWIVNGTFNFCSGAPYATHFMGHTLPSQGVDGRPRAPMLFIAPRDSWTMLDDWGRQLGLKGSGSHSIEFVDAFVPDRFTVPETQVLALDVSQGTTGSVLHGNPMYGGSPFSFLLLEAGSMAVGIAQGALAAYDELMTTKQIPIPPFCDRTEDPDYQRYYGEAVGKIAAAEAALLHCAGKWMTLAEQGRFTPEVDARLIGICNEVIALCWDALSMRLFRTAGSTSVRTGERIERAWRDISTIHSHNALVNFAEMSRRQLSVAHFGSR